MTTKASRRFHTGLQRTAIGLAALIATVAGASQVRPVNLEEMAARAAVVFHGQCISARVEIDEVSKQPFTVATFAVERLVKGEVETPLTVRIPSDVAPGAKSTAAFREGEDVVLFLYGVSGSGFTSPVGLGQGRFSVVTDKQGRRVARNGYENRHLLRGLSPTANSRLAPLLETDRIIDGIDPDVLLDMARSLKDSR